MRLTLLLSFPLLLLANSAHASSIICLPGKSPGAQVVHIGSNQRVGYKTQHGDTYGNTKCVVHFKKSRCCPSLVVSCPKFDIAHPNPNCKGKEGDFLSLGKKRFCQKKGPNNFNSAASKLTVSFISNKKVHGEGAECTVACSDLTPTSSGIDGEWQEWGEWSQCTASCGQGLKIRARACSQPASGGNEQCSGDSTEVENCSSAECPVMTTRTTTTTTTTTTTATRIDGEWQEWSEWSHCDPSCSCGKKFRSRHCNNAPSAAACDGDRTETAPCSESPNPGQLVVGGHDGNYLSSVELFPRPSSDTCSIPELPQGRFGHSLSLLSGGRLVVCGGYPHDSCISWVAGNTSWTHLYTMSALHCTATLHCSVARRYHTAWTPPSLPDSIVLLGGYGSAAELSAEIVPGGETFPLKHSGDGACGIPDGQSIVLTGGRRHNYVTRYNVNGFVEELTQLPENRYGHACAALPTGAFIVAGGKDVDGGESNYLSSVLTFLPGATAWTQLASLPRPLISAQASIVGGKIRVNGGWDGNSDQIRSAEVLEYQPEPFNQWLTIGDLQQARTLHATLSIGAEQLPCLSSGSEE